MSIPLFPTTYFVQSDIYTPIAGNRLDCYVRRLCNHTSSSTVVFPSLNSCKPQLCIETYAVRITPEADFQRRNASIAVELAKTALPKFDKDFNPRNDSLTPEFVVGLETII